MNTLDRISRKRLFADLGYKPHLWQWEVHRSRASRRIVACGVRAGKTKCAAMEGIAAALDPKERSIGWVVAPTYDLADRVFKEMQIVVLEKLRHLLIELRASDRRILLRNMAGGISEIRAKSADNPDSLLGEGLDWVIVDEAARLKPSIWEAHLTQRLLDKNGWAMLISTPKGKGYFHDLFRRGQGGDPEFASWNLPSWANPELDPAILEAERERLPERVFNQEYGAQFTEGSGAVFRNIRELAIHPFEEPQAHRRYVGGLDLAKVEDYTVFSILSSEGRIVFVDRFHRLDWQLQMTRIKATCDRYRVLQVFADSTGVGDPIVEALCAGGCPAIGYVLTRPSKAALIDNLSLLFEKRILKLPSPKVWPEGIDELEGFQFSITETGHVRTSAPSGQHDDCVISVALAAWAIRAFRRYEPGPIRMIPLSDLARGYIPGI